MRILRWKTIMICAFATNVTVSFFMWLSLDRTCECTKDCPTDLITHMMHRSETNYLNNTDAQISEKIMILIRDFEFFENEIPLTLKSIVASLPLVKILIISDRTIYPPIKLDKSIEGNVQFVSLKPNPNQPTEMQQPHHFLQREHVFIFPDSVSLENSSLVRKMLEAHYRNPENIIASMLKDSPFECLSLNVSLRYWTMKYGKSEGFKCDALEGQAILLTTRTLLLQLGFPFSRPFFTAFFVQTALKKVKIEVLKDVSFKGGRPLFSDSHLQWKHEAAEAERKQIFFQEMGIKKIIYPASKVEWYGCSKKTPRCFGTVINNMPEYLYQNRWTPPCCLEHLRKTARYVFGILEKCNVRYWLEGGSLLGAARTGDIIPWDFDIDIGVYRDDIPKCEWLKNTYLQSFVDMQGFLWEKAREGDFLRVQFSETNHLHVDIFPFYSRNGTMTKDTWFVNHKQDMEFPEHFLQPLQWVKFVGVKVSAPNNYKEFLELKFGKGVVENPEYPDPSAMMYPRRAW